MPRVPSLPRSALPEFESVFARRESDWGVVANAILVMGHRPDILRAWNELLQRVLFEGEVDRTLKRLVALMRSSAAGCRYCQAHTASHGFEDGVELAKIEAVWDFERSPLFDGAERAALRLARDAAQMPNGVTDEHFDELRQHFDDGQIVELVAVISLYAFLNSWNDTLATPLEELPRKFASEHLTPAGWSADKHA